MLTYVTNGGDLIAAHCQDSACTTSSPAVVETMSPYGLGNSSITIGNDGLPLISYDRLDGTGGGQLRVAHCSNGLCTASVRTTVAPSTDGYRLTSIAIGADGLGVIAYVDDLDRLRLARCGNVHCTVAGRLVVVPEALQPVPRDPGMTIGTDGLPIIVTTGGAVVRVVHLSDRFGLPYHRRR